MAHTIYRVNQMNPNPNLKSPEVRQRSRIPSDQNVQDAEAANRKMRQSKQSRIVLVSSVAAILLIFTAVIFLLYNQSRVLAVTAENAKIQKQINEYTKENSKKRESISKNLDLEKIRQEAMRLGLQNPQEQQIRELQESKRDQIVVNLRSANAEGVDTTEDDMTAIFANVEGFFKTIR